MSGATQAAKVVRSILAAARQRRRWPVLSKRVASPSPEAIYFTGNQSGRGAVGVYDFADGSQVPAVGEPWFLTFDAHIEYSVAISGQEMDKANLDYKGHDRAAARERRYKKHQVEAGWSPELLKHEFHAAPIISVSELSCDQDCRP